MELREITPEEYRCMVAACPAIFETPKGTYVIIGRVVSAEMLGDTAVRVGDGESAVEIDAKMLKEALNGMG